MFLNQLKKKFLLVKKQTNLNFQLKKYSHENIMATSSDENKISMMFTLLDGKKGILCDALQVLKKYDINITYINSKPSKFTSSISKNVDFFIDVEKPMKDGDLIHAINDLKKYVENFELIENEEVPWFPKCLGDINLIGKQTMTAGVELESDHPGFNDPVYRQRRSEIAKASENYIIGQPHPIIVYTDEEKKLWNNIWDLLAPLHKQYACEEFNENKKIFMNEMNFRGKEIPQLGEISNFLKKRTNTIFRPVDGLLTSREFLNSLAFGVFSSTQYLRHHSMPLYTPEPDIIHEFLGHAPMFANKDFSDFSQEIGLASLGASDEEIKKLGTIYWFTIEFGVTIEDGKRKIYGGGILSSPSETEWAASSKPKFHEFDIDTIATFPFTITKIQEDYFLAPSFKKMKETVRKYSDSIKRPFNVSYNVDTNVVTIDRKYKTKKL